MNPIQKNLNPVRTLRLCRGAWLGIWLLALLGWGGCERCEDPSNPECPNYCVDETDPACPNYEPCWDQQPVSAAFHMYERKATRLPDEWVDYDTDTLCGWGVEFSALEEEAEYEWHLGSETIRSRSFVRTAFPEGVPLTVTLIVRKTPNVDCFPDDDGRDTLTRTFVHYEGSRYCWRDREKVIITPIHGRYEGTFASEPGVLRQIEVMPCGMYVIPRSQPDTVYRPGILGLLPTDTCGQWSIDATGPTFFGYRQWFFSADNIFYVPKEDRGACGRAISIRLYQSPLTDSLFVTYLAQEQASEPVRLWEFSGKKTY